MKCSTDFSRKKEHSMSRLKTLLQLERQIHSKAQPRVMGQANRLAYLQIFRYNEFADTNTVWWNMGTTCLPHEF